MLETATDLEPLEAELIEAKQRARSIKLHTKINIKKLGYRNRLKWLILKDAEKG